MCSRVNVFYEEICPGNLADFTVNILTVSYYLVVGLNFYPSLPRLMSVDYKWFVRECLQQKLWLSSLNKVEADREGLPPVQQEIHHQLFQFPISCAELPCWGPSSQVLPITTEQ